jgi:perosamine synthetase
MIGIHEPDLIRKSYKAIKSCLDTNWVSTLGKHINIFEKNISSYVKSNYVLCTNSGTSSLHLAVKVLRPKNEDEIIVPTITFIAPINAVIYSGCKPIFMDCDKYLNINQSKTIEFLLNNTFSKKIKNTKYTFNKKTKKRIIAIIITHVLGNPSNFGELFKLCKKKNIKIIEDAAESFGSKYISGSFSGKFTGTIGDIGCYSFNGNKIITSGNGGALITNNQKYYQYAKYLSTQSKNNNFKFIHNEIGFNYKLSNINAALGNEQLKNIEIFIRKKKKIKDIYNKYFTNKNGVNLLMSPPYARCNNWLMAILIDKKIYKKSINELINEFVKKKIQVRPIWFPNHKQKFLKKYENYRISLANKYENYLCLPSSSFLSRKLIKKICNIF